MQDRYAGDVGDYGKIGLLKCLQVHGFSIGVNWYHVPEMEIEKNQDGTFKQDDGKHLVPDSLKECDPELAEKLTKIAKGRNRSISAIQRANLIPDAVYYNDSLTVDGRSEWHERSMKVLKDADLVFMDPDNGLLVKSVGKKSVRSVKYTFYEEIKDYIDSGRSVLVYNHRSRKPENDYFDDLEDKLQKNVRVYRHLIQEITFPKGSIRDYFAIPACKEHYEMICKAFADMKGSKWGQLGVCRLHPEWADELDIDYMTYDDHIFTEIECESFKEDSTFEEYKEDIIRYLTLSTWKYTEKQAMAIVEREMNYIEESFDNKESVADTAVEIGYACG